MKWENKSEVHLHFVMALIGGFFGGYAIFGRMSVFGSAQTANLIDLVGDILGREPLDAAVRIGALLLYVSAMVLFVFLSRRTSLNLRYLVFPVEAAAVLILVSLPKDMDPVVALYPVFFAASFQWCIFKGAEGYACATIFSTNNLKQTVLSFTEYFLSDSEEEREKSLKKGRFFGETLLCFHAGVAAAFVGIHTVGLSVIWFQLIFVFAGLCMTEAQDRKIRRAFHSVLTSNITEQETLNKSHWKIQ